MQRRAPGPDASDRDQTNGQDTLGPGRALPVSAPDSPLKSGRFPIALETPGEHLRNALQLIELELEELRRIERRPIEHPIPSLEESLERIAAIRARVTRALHQLEVADRIDAKAEQFRRERRQGEQRTFCPVAIDQADGGVE